MFYYEVTLRHVDVGANVSMGFARNDYSSGRHVGYRPYSLAIHSDDGRRFMNDKETGSDYITGGFLEGDVIGLGMVYHAQSSQHPAPHPSRNLMFLTRNGEYIGIMFKSIPFKSLKPSIGCKGRCVVQCNFGGRKFKWVPNATELKLIGVVPPLSRVAVTPVRTQMEDTSQLKLQGSQSNVMASAPSLSPVPQGQNQTQLPVPAPLSVQPSAPNLHASSFALDLNKPEEFQPVVATPKNLYARH
jgi:hypothetical protein